MMFTAPSRPESEPGSPVERTQREITLMKPEEVSEEFKKVEIDVKLKTKKEVSTMEGMFLCICCFHFPFDPS